MAINTNLINNNVNTIIPTFPDSDFSNVTVEKFDGEVITPANKTEVEYNVFIPGFKYTSKGPLWIDKIEIFEKTGELLYNNNYLDGVNKIEFIKQNTSINTLSGLHFNKLSESESLLTNLYSEYLSTNYGADKNKFIDVIKETESELTHYLTVYPTCEDDFNQNQNTKEHVGLCYLKTKDSTKEFNIVYKLYSELSDGNYILIHTGELKYTPIGITVDGDINYSCDKVEDVFTLIYDQKENISKLISIKLNEDETIPVIYNSGLMYFAEYKDDTYEKGDEINPDDFKICVYPLWSSNQKNEKTDVFNPNYLMTDNSGKSIVIITARDINSEGIAPVVNGYENIFTDLTLKRLREYFKENYKLYNYTGEDLIKRGILNTQLIASNFSQNFIDWSLNNPGKFITGGLLSEYEESFGKRLNVCGASAKNSSRFFDHILQFGLSKDFGKYKWGNRYAAENFSDRSKYFGRSYMLFLINLIGNSTGFIKFRDWMSSTKTINVIKNYSYTFIKDYTPISYLYKNAPSVAIMNRGTESGRLININNEKSENQYLILSAIQNITGVGNIQNVLYTAYPDKNKKLNSFKIIKNTNLLLENPNSEVVVTLNDSGKYSFDTMYHLSGYINNVDMFYYTPNAKLFYDVSNLQFSNESDYSVIAQFELNKEMINSNLNETYTLPIGFNGTDLVISNLTLSKDNTPEPIFEKYGSEINSFKFSSTLKNIDDKVKYSNSISYTVPELKAESIYVLLVNYLRYHPESKNTIKISIDIDGESVYNYTEKDTFVFCIKSDKQNVNIKVKSNINKDVIYSVGLYTLDESKQEYTIIKDYISLNNYNRDIITIDNVDDCVYMPIAFCFSEYGKTCYKQSYNYTHLPRQAYLKAAGWYEVSDDNQIEPISNKNPYYKYSNNNLFRNLKNSGKIQNLRF